MYRLIEKFHLDRYVSARLILLMDLVLSVGASLVAIFLTDLFFESVYDAVAVIPTMGNTIKLEWLIAAALLSLVFFVVLRVHKGIIRHSTLRELWKISVAVTLKGAGLLVLLLCVAPRAVMLVAVATLLMDMLLTLAAMIVTRVAMVVVYDMMKRTDHKRKSCQRVLVYGIGDKSVALVTRLQNSHHYQVVGFLVDGDHTVKSHLLAELPVYYFDTMEDVAYVIKRSYTDAILFSSKDEAQKEQSRLIDFGTDLEVKILIAPPIDEVIDGKVMQSSIREIKIEDLLGRPEIKISMNEIRANFAGKVVMVTGAAGSIGSEICRQLATFGVRQLVLFDNAETPMHNLRLELEERFPELNFVPVIGDIRQVERLDFAFRKFHPQVVFHAGAYKHVPLMEENPCEAILVNVAGSRNVANKCIEFDVEMMVMISTDKAVNPTNIMGCTKRLAEIYVQSLGLAVEKGKVQGKTKFVTTRFGNVLGSNGSVIPRFREQIAHGGPVTVTHPDITRFFMTIPEACRLVLEAATMSTGNQIFVFDMGESVKIVRLATRMIELAGFTPDVDIKIEYTGLRPGEKLYEEVLSNKENTLPTEHDRIRIAKVREYNHEDAKRAVDQLEEFAREVNIPESVRLMKRTVPEFKSKNSEYEAYDRELEQTGQQEA